MTFTGASWAEPAALLALLALAALVAALGLVRAGPWYLRVATGLAAGLLAVSIAGPFGWVDESRPARLRLVATGDVPPDVSSQLEAKFDAALDLVEATPDRGELALALAGGGSGAVRRLLVVAPVAGDGAPAKPVAGVRALSTVAPLAFDPREVAVNQVGEARVGRPFALEVVGLPRAFAGGLEVRALDGTVTASGTFSSEPPAAGPEATTPRVRVEFTPLQVGRLEVTLEAAASGVRLSARGAAEVGPAPALLAVGPGAEPVARALRAQGFRVEVDGALPALSSDVAVVVATGVLAVAEQERLAEFAAAGGGVLLVGSPDGGALPLRDEPAGGASPVILAERPQRPGTGTGGEGLAAPPAAAGSGEVPPRPPERDAPARGDTSGAKPATGPERTVERRTVAMVFLLDRSQSMQAEAAPGWTRLDYVRASAQATAGRLLPGDELAVVTFGDPGREDVLLPLTPATELARVREALARLASGNEGTYVDSALQKAIELLAASRAAVKHVVVITDGEIADLLPAYTRAHKVRAAGGTVSMIQFGADLDPVRDKDLCRKFVAAGGGGYLHSTDSSEVPALVSSEVKRVLSTTGRPMGDEADRTAPGEARAPAHEPPPAADPVAPEPVPPAPSRLAVRVLEASPLLDPIPGDGPPPVGGVLAVSARPEARVLLVAGDEGRPLLAFKNYGLGRVAAWTADLTGEWSSEWRAADAFPGWLAQWVAALLPPTPDRAAVDLLSVRTVEPLGPTPAQAAALAAYTGEALQPWQAEPIPAPSVVRVQRSYADVFAILAAGALVLLAGIEFAAARRTPVEPQVSAGR